MKDIYIPNQRQIKGKAKKLMDNSAKTSGRRVTEPSRFIIRTKHQKRQSEDTKQDKIYIIDDGYGQLKMPQSDNKITKSVLSH